ncbi:MAG: hypothetical protein MUE75_12755 [Algoriphagus sp.]|nr:hypothetical protein [Algoriphagus sp.]
MNPMIAALQPNDHFLSDKTLKTKAQKLRRLIADLRQRQIPENLIQTINSKIEEINSCSLSGKHLEKLMTTRTNELLKLLEKELKLVPKHHYRTLWMLMGMSSFGLPLGVVFGMSIGNIGLLGVGLPIGMAIGIALGASLDEKARKEGRQLNLSEEE